MLKFEGQFSNGKRNGKGREYDNNGLLYFEGEYLNGKRNGKGKEYSDGVLIYEGEYLNGEMHDKFKKYDSDGYLMYDGEYLNDKLNVRFYKKGIFISETKLMTEDKNLPLEGKLMYLYKKLIQKRIEYEEEI